MLYLQLPQSKQGVKEIQVLVGNLQWRGSNDFHAIGFCRSSLEAEEFLLRILFKRSLYDRFRNLVGFQSLVTKAPTCVACALYDNWWPMLSVIMYVLVPMPLLFFAGSDASLLFEEASNDSWVNATKFLTGASTIGSIAIPVILKHAGVIGWGALAMQLSSFVVLILSIMCFVTLNADDGYSML
ncbi:hypothetical protein KSS87_007675 [Heliosperma pusillum]|nr:hypothetical protein KSS87_007675 [Heliosperma pusillum]